MEINKLSNHNFLINREIGIINFLKRILYNANDDKNPLLERLSFLCIVVNNCDELFEVRISKLIKNYKENKNKILDDGLEVKEVLKTIKYEINKLYIELYKSYNNIIQQFNKVNIEFLNKKNWNKEQRLWIYNYFLKNIKPLLLPISVNPLYKFPRASNKTLNFAIYLKDNKHSNKKYNVIIMDVPQYVPLILKIPIRLSKGKEIFILLQDIIKEFIHDFFSDLNVVECIPFKITRSTNIDLNLDVENIKSEIIYEINNRKYSFCSRLEVEVSDNSKVDQHVIKVLSKQFNLDKQYIYYSKTPLTLGKLIQIKSLIRNNSVLSYPKFIQANFKIPPNSNIFDLIDKNDILIHTPFESFDTVIKLSRMAVEDSSVIAIKVTIYRTEYDSELVRNLIQASKIGKDVTVSIELFARFDEESNIALSNQLEKAGVKVIYGEMKYKVHTKIMLLIKKEKNKLKYYAHLGTGNYNKVTAKLYTDFHLITSNYEICNDVNKIFIKIANSSSVANLKKIYYSPNTLYDMLIKFIDQEINNVKNGKRGKIIAKVNSLNEPTIIKKLYEASCVGVEIQLIVRGSCSLIPGIKNLSQRISVISIVGKFLEHNRVYYFYNLGSENVFISSADWMHRSFFKRIETCIPILEPNIKKKVIQEGLEFYLNDNVNAWIMNNDGSYVRLTNKKPDFCAQEFLLKKKAVVVNG